MLQLAPYLIQSGADKWRGVGIYAPLRLRDVSGWMAVRKVTSDRIYAYELGLDTRIKSSGSIYKDETVLGNTFARTERAWLNHYKAPCNGLYSSKVVEVGDEVGTFDDQIKNGFLLNSISHMCRVTRRKVTSPGDAGIGRHSNFHFRPLGPPSGGSWSCSAF